MSKTEEDSWVEEIVIALEALGGIASLHQIQEYIGKTTKRELSTTWREIIGKTIGRNSADSEDTQKVGRDIFYSVEGLGKGIWGLRSGKISSTPIAPDSGNDSPKRIKQETYRILRDTALAKHLKILYENKCQICDKSIALKKKHYSEAHHIKPLDKTKHNGPDTPGNIIVLCPEHHVEFDYGVIAVEPITLTVIHKDKNNSFFGKKITLLPEHELNDEYLSYHIAKIYEKAKN